MEDLSNVIEVMVDQPSDLPLPEINFGPLEFEAELVIPSVALASYVHHDFAGRKATIMVTDPNLAVMTGLKIDFVLKTVEGLARSYTFRV